MSKNNQKFNSASQNISESHAPFSVGLSCLSNALSVSTYITASQSAAPNDINIPKTTVPSNAFVCTMSEWNSSGFRIDANKRKCCSSFCFEW